MLLYMISPSLQVGSRSPQRTHALRPVGKGDTGIAVVEEGWRFDAKPVLACERIDLSLLGSLLGLGKSLVFFP